MYGHRGYVCHVTINGVQTYLWFDENALEAAEFYVGLFPGSRINNISRYQADAQKPEGTVLTVDFELFHQPFAALNGGPQFPHSEAISFQVTCDTQEEIDHLWNSLIADGGSESMCGWCKDRFGISWQIIPSSLGSLLASDDTTRSRRAFEAMMTMHKLDIAALRAAFDG